MYRRLIYLLLVISFAGCSSSFKSNFRNFNAYYNTYFNAKKSYQAGLDKSLSQARQYNTLQPIQVYETPLGAGAAEFNNVIEKGANVLRKYKNTKWVDNALEIIGKSYFYRKEYFNAQQKFDELYISSESEEMKQRAVFWKGRVLLELQAHNQGVQYLNEQLSLREGEWRGDLESQVKVVLAEHYVARENWVNALDLLNESLANIPGRANKERGYFLMGQINELLGNPEAAFDAYNRVEKYYAVYELQFEAKKKKAEVARNIGDTDEAFKVFSSMVRDDKNTEFVAELNFELGKTEQDRGNYQEARKIYERILRDPFTKPGNITKARVYNGLAEIYRFDLDNYQMAAAYYDSSARLNIAEDQLPEEYNAKELSVSFGEYSRLKNQIHEQDSLLWLGSLSQEEFDSVLVVMENKLREELEQQRRDQEERRNTLVNVGGANTNESNNTGNERNGFLNVRNPVLIAEASEQFQAIWGGRPLVDNWRVEQLIVNAVVEDSVLTNGRAQENVGNGEEILVNIDLSRIPFTPQAKDSVREELAFLHYELGNLFFLSLNLPDSSRYYFNKVLDERPESDVAPVVLYSLSELYAIDNEMEKATSLAEQLVKEYPESLYANRMISKFDLERPPSIAVSSRDSYELFLATRIDTALSILQKADSLASLSLQNKNARFADRAMHESITFYIEDAKNDSVFTDSLHTWQRLHYNWKEEQAAFKSDQDSARSWLADTSKVLEKSDSLYYRSLLDSTLTSPDFDRYFPYEGEAWDTIRVRVDQFLEHFRNSTLLGVVQKWDNEFQVPKKTETTQEEETPAVPEPIAAREGYLSCDDIDVLPEIRGGMELFNQTLNIPDGVEDEYISFMFYIDQRGVVDDFEHVSESENERLITAYINAIESFISFEPILVEGTAQPVSCEIEFSIPEK